MDIIFRLMNMYSKKEVIKYSFPLKLLKFISNPLVDLGFKPKVHIKTSKF